MLDAIETVSDSLGLINTAISYPLQLGETVRISKDRILRFLALGERLDDANHVSCASSPVTFTGAFALCRSFLAISKDNMGEGR